MVVASPAEVANLKPLRKAVDLQYAYTHVTHFLNLTELEKRISWI